MDTFIILGSLNAKKEDRELSRIEMKPFQLFRKGDFIDVDFF